MELSLVSYEDRVARVQVSGDVTHPDMVSFDEPIGKLLGGGCYAERLLLDLHLVETIDSSGVSWLLVCQRKFRTAGGMLVLHSLSPFVQDVVKVLNMRLVFTIADSEQAALALVRGVRAAG